MTNSLLGAMQMSDMLEQAIIDAEALRAAATKNAETLILEKYSNQIKDSIETLLEQDAPMDLGADLGADLGLEPDLQEPAGAMSLDADIPSDIEMSVSSVMEHIPFAATALDDEQVEIPLDKLLEEVDAIKNSMKTTLLSEDSPLEEEQLEEAEIGEDLDEDLNEELDEDLDEELDINEDLLEALVVDIHPVKTGWAGTSESYIQLAEEELLALEQDSEVREQKAAMRKAVKDLTELSEAKEKENQDLLLTLEKTRNIALKLQKAVGVLEEKLDNANTTNVKLLYQNKALNSDSLNERQKQRLAEAISNAENAEEAKVIFETLQNTVGSTLNKSQPNSLSEAVQKSSSVILSARKQTSSRENTNPTLSRWKFLAGIDKN
jgi:hypothetical protein